MIDAAMVDKIRVYKRLQSVEREDSEFASRLLIRLRQSEAETPEGAEVELSAVFRFLQSDIDRQVLALWLNDVPHTQIAEHLDCTPAAVRQRWQSIRNRLKERMLSGAF
jgi:DNA-directed RNA polymerase specialized sigma24 family protein